MKCPEPGDGKKIRGRQKFGPLKRVKNCRARTGRERDGTINEKRTPHRGLLYGHTKTERKKKGGGKTANLKQGNKGRAAKKVVGT